jgi:hypothetical protein
VTPTLAIDPIARVHRRRAQARPGGFAESFRFADCVRFASNDSASSDASVGSLVASSSFVGAG